MIPQNIIASLVEDVQNHVYLILDDQFTYEEISDDEVDRIAQQMAREFSRSLTEHFHKIEKSSEN